jgi:hypothetical protein
MTNMNNVRVITEKLMGIIKQGDLYDTHIRAELVSNIAELAERHSPDNMWYLDCMIQLLEQAGEMVTTRILSNFLHLVNDWKDDTEMAEHVVRKFYDVVT